MLTLDQVRAVNDGLKKGDLNAALQPLEEQIDLRHAELPRLDKAAIAAIKTGLQDAENARIWAEAAFHPNVSVRRFARKTLLGLCGEAAPVAPPLQARIERFWSEETPLPWANNAREAAARRDQMERIQTALDILLRADPNVFMKFWACLSDAARPARERQKQQYKEWNERQAAYSEAYKKHTEAIVRDELGVATGSQSYVEVLHSLPSRLWREVYERVQNHPEIKALQEQLGENARAQAAQQWQPTQLFTTAIIPYLQPDATAPQREVAVQVRGHFWQWVEEALDSEAEPDVRDRALARVHDNIANYWLVNSLGYEQIWERLPALLSRTKPHLLESISAAFDNSPVRADAGRLWALLAQALGQSCRRPYNLKEGEWAIPESITPELLRSFKIKGVRDMGANYGLEEGAKEVAKLRPVAPTPVAEVPPAEVPPAEEPSPAETTIQSAIEAITLNFHDVDWDAITAEAQRTGEDWTTVYERSKPQPLERTEAEAEVHTLEDIEEKIEKILEPPMSQSQVRVRRMPYWQLWKRKLGRKLLMEQLWPLLGPKLWARYEAKLEEYRRVETDEITPQLGQKLTAREIKEWKTEQRRLKRNTIEGELHDMATVLRDAEGFDADLKLLQVLERPGCKELLKSQHYTLLNLLARSGFNSDLQSRQQASNPEWVRQNWFLDAKWAPLLEKIEAHLLSNKRASPWERQNYLTLLAIVNYRFNTPKNRARFLELAGETESLGQDLLYPVMALGDVETWLLLISKIDFYPNADLQNLWKQTHANQSPDAPRLTARVLENLGHLTNDRAAKFSLEMLGQLSPAELAPHGEAIVSLLECPLVPVKRWALATIPTLPDLEYDAEVTARLVGEMLWAEGALPKDAAKFLGTLAPHLYGASTAWEELCGATSLENITLLESIFRALAQIRAKNSDFVLDETAKSRLEALVDAQPDRFTRFSKKLV